MSEAVVDDIVAVLPPLLQSLEAIGFIARHLNPPDFDRVMEAAGAPDQALRAVRARLAGWPEEFRASAHAVGDRERRGARGIRRLARGAERPVAISSPYSAHCVTRRARRKRCIRWQQDCRR